MEYTILILLLPLLSFLALGIGGKWMSAPDGGHHRHHWYWLW